MSILEKLATLNKADSSNTRQAMTPEEVELCRIALRDKNRGYNVHPNSFDVNVPYRVAINFNNKWYNFGNFKSDDVAAAIGSIVSVAFFGDKAKSGEYDPKVVENHEEFKAWMLDSRNQEVIAKANGESPCVYDGGELTQVHKKESNPF